MIASALFVALASAQDAANTPGSRFDDHTRDHFDSTDAFFSYADRGQKPVQLKFVIAQFDSDHPLVFFLDPKFYEFHDQWYWFSLLNGVHVPGCPVSPDSRTQFVSVADVFKNFRGQANLPLKLRLIEKRVYSDEFYAFAMGYCSNRADGRCDRKFAVGSVLFLPADTKRRYPREMWAFELEHEDKPNEAMIQRLADILTPKLPKLPDPLHWLARTSEFQEQLASEIQQHKSPWAARTHRYADLVVPGAIAAYNRGAAAGQLKFIGKGQLGRTTLRPTDIAVLEEIPDELPPVAAIVTAVPQTPQAHLNLLAIARGTPNVHIAGIFGDLQLRAMARADQPVALLVGENGVHWKAISPQDWQHWYDRNAPQNLVITSISLRDAPYFVDLTRGGLAMRKRWLPYIGGKSAGLMALLAQADFATPYQPLAMTVRPYAEFMVPFWQPLQNLLNDPGFRKDRRLRFLALEGPKAYAKAHKQDKDALEWLQELDKKAQTQAIRVILEHDGVRPWIERRGLPSAMLNKITTTLQKRYAQLAPQQGLRFRSSSTAEDVEGFNGAGLYESHTGYLHAAELTDEKLHKKTIARAILQTFSSYWRFDAYDEREEAGLSHFAGNMAVLIEPGFADALEDANGVVLVGLGKDAQDGARLEMTVNVLNGATSVTNPVASSQILPEIDKIVRTESGQPKIERVQLSNQEQAPKEILSDAELLKMFEQMDRLSRLWLENAAVGLHPGDVPRSVTLDLEFRRVKAGWPQRSDAILEPARLVWKQVRTLTRPSRLNSRDVNGMHVPRDVLAGAHAIVRRRCSTAAFEFETTSIYTDPAAPLIGHAIAPLEAMMQWTFKRDLPSLGIAQGKEPSALHHEIQVSHPTTATTEQWDLLLKIPANLAANWGFDTFALRQDGTWILSRGDTKTSGKIAGCSATRTALSPAAWLENMLQQ